MSTCRPGPDMSPAARVRVFAAEPALSGDAAAALCHALELLLAQYQREGRCTAGAVWSEAGGRFIVVAWDGPPLSGCSNDKINQVLATHEQRQGVCLLTAPPIAIGPATAVRLVDRAGLKAAIAAGTVDATTPVWPLTAGELAVWRSGPVALAAGPFARLL